MHVFVHLMFFQLHNVKYLWVLNQVLSDWICRAKYVSKIIIYREPSMRRKKGFVCRIYVTAQWSSFHCLSQLCLGSRGQSAGSGMITQPREHKGLREDWVIQAMEGRYGCRFLELPLSQPIVKMVRVVRGVFYNYWFKDHLKNPHPPSMAQIAYPWLTVLL